MTDVTQKNSKRWFFAIVFSLIILSPAVSALVVNINELPVFVRPKDGSGTLIPTTGFNYVFNFTTSSACTGVLLSRTHYITTDKYGVGFVNIDTTPLVGGPVPSYMCEYRDGILRETHTLNPNIFGEDTGSGATGTFNATQGPYLYDNGVVVFFNETKLNQTINSLDDDTTYSNGTGILLSGTTFLLDLTYFNANFVGQTEYPFLDTNSADDVLSVTGGDGLYNTGTATAPIINVGGGTGIVLAADNISVDNLIVPFKNSAETISGAWVFNNGLTVNGNLNVVGSLVNLTVTQQIINGSIYPDLSGIFDLGSPSALWNTVYANSLIGALDWSNLTGVPGDLDLVASDDVTNVSTAGGQLTGTFNALSIVPNSVSASQLNLTDITLADFLNDVGYLTGFNETDPYFTAANSTLARTGNCPSGEFVQNTTTGGVQCAAPAMSVDEEGINATQGPYLYDDGATAFFNDTLLNQTISSLTNAAITALNITNGTDGMNGTNGIDGINGTNGESTNITVVDLGGGIYQWQFYYVPSGINYANFTTANLTGPQGIQGIQGVAGTNGTNGIDGTNGTNGQDTNVTVLDLGGGIYQWQFFYGNGTNYANFTTSNLTGPQGIQGIQGVAGTNGTNGIDGTNGTNGANANLSNIFAGTGIIVTGNSTQITVSLNSTYTDTLYDTLGAASAVNTTANIQSLGFNTTNELTTLFGGFYYSINNPNNYVNLSNLSGWDTNASDDFNGSWSALTGVPAGFADGVDNDTQYQNGTGITLSGTTFSLNTGYTATLYDPLGAAAAVNTTNNIKSLGFNTTSELTSLFTYYAGTGLVLTNNTFSINQTYLNNSIDARATSPAFNLQNVTNNGATTTNRIFTGGLNSTANITLAAGTCLNGASGGYICFNSTHTWIG